MFVPLILILISLGSMIYVFVRLTKHSSIAVHKYIRINCYLALSSSVLYLLGLLFSENNSIVFDILRFVTSLAYLNMFVALFTMSIMICGGIVRSFIQPIKIGSTRSQMVERRFAEWYGLHVLQGNRISFMQYVFLGLTDNISRIGGSMPSEKRVQNYFIGVFVSSFFYGVNSFYFLANVIREMSIIDRFAPSINKINSVEPIIEAFRYLVVWSVEQLISLVGVNSLLIALAIYELTMLVFFFRKNNTFQKHLHEYFFIHTEEEIQGILDIEKAYDELTSVFWKRTVFGEAELTGELYDLDGEHWAIKTHSKIRHNDNKKLDIALCVEELNNQGIWEGISEEDYAIANECESFDIEISNNKHSLMIHGETKEIIQQSTNFPKDVLEMIQMRIDEGNSSLIES